MRQELTIFSAGAIFIVIVALIVSVRSPDPSGIVTISTAVSSMIVIFNGHPQLSSAIWIGGIVVFLVFALVGAFCFKVTK